ncbi:Alpha/Beta hydrolase protein [Mycena epipterygia]|nr:Alpha/Beta hydrolase protein [Mycena epipterygia]
MSSSCGLPCQSLSGETFLQSGGDQRDIPLYFIAHDKVDQSLVVAHEGTDPGNILSILNDADFVLENIDATRFPQAAGKGIKVHSGLQQTFERTADGLLAGVKAGLASTGVSKVVVTGHSLGAALAIMTGAMIKDAVDPSVNVAVTTFGLPPRAWVDFLDSDVGVTFVTNQNDSVPTVPPRTNLVACPGQDNEHCATGSSLFHASVTNHLGPYFDNITFGSAVCSS